MTYRGRVKNGMIVLDPAIQLPEGLEVEVITPEQRVEDATWGEVLKDFIGKAEELPGDSSRNHDHYLYHQPQK